MTEWTQGARPRGWVRAWLATGAAVLAVVLGSSGPTAQTTGTKTTTTGTTTPTTTGTTGTTASTATTASSQPAVSQSALFEQFLFEMMIDLVFEDFLAMGGGTPDEFLTFLEGTLGGLIGPELTAAANGQMASFPDTDDEDLAFEEFLMEFFVAQAQADFNAAGGGTAAQFQTFLAKALATAGTPQLASVSKQVAAADAAAATTSTTTGTTTSGTTTTGTTGTKSTTTGTTGTKTTTTGTTTTPGG